MLRLVSHPATPTPQPSFRDLTIGQVIALLQIHGGPDAAPIVGELRIKTSTFRQTLPEDLCALALRGLIRCDRSEGVWLTERGRRWLGPLVGY